MQNKKWTKKYLLVLWSVTLIIIIIALFGHVWRFTDNVFFLRDGSVEEEHAAYNSNEITDIEIDADVADIDINYGSKFDVNFKYPKKYMPTSEISNGKLKIEQQNIRMSVNGMDDCEIEITIPHETKLNKIDIKAAAGDIDLEGITVDSLIIDADAGDIDLESVVSTNIKIVADAGDINVVNCKGQSIDVDASLGDIDISNEFEQVDVECELGDIDIDIPGIDNDKIHASCELGSIKVNGHKW